MKLRQWMGTESATSIMNPLHWCKEFATVRYKTNRRDERTHTGEQMYDTIKRITLLLLQLNSTQIIRNAGNAYM